MHIFWQKRIVEGNAQTKWWYPFQTNSGAIRQDRIVFPIPPGVHWKDVRAVVVPTMGSTELPAPKPKQIASRKVKGSNAKPVGPPPGKMGILVGGKIKYVDRPGYVPEKPVKAPRVKAEKAPAPKFDSKYLAGARELRDRYLEQVNCEGSSGGVFPGAKYEVSRALENPASLSKPTLLLAAA